MSRTTQSVPSLTAGESSSATGRRQQNTSPSTQASSSQAAEAVSGAQHLSALLTEEDLENVIREAYGLDSDHAMLQQILFSAAATANVAAALENSEGESSTALPSLSDLGAGIDAVNQAGDTSLYDAVVGGDVEIVRVLLELGADPNSTGTREEFSSPLHAAAAKDSVEMLELLLDNGALVEIKDHRNWTALMVATHCGHFVAMRFLLNCGADINTRSNAGVTALMLSARTEDADIVQYLIDHGAGVNDAEVDGWTTLHFCARNGNPIAAATLLKNGACVHPKASNGRTPLIIAAAGGRLDMMQLLLENGANASVADDDGRSAMTTSIAATNRDAVSLLCRYGVDINYCNGSLEATSLVGAVIGGKRELVEFCLSIGCDVHAEDKDGWTALHFAAKTGNVEIGKLLLRRGAKLESGTQKKPLHVALGKGQVVFVCWLLSAGAKVHAEGVKGLKSMHYAAAKHDQGEEVYEQLMRILLKKRVKINQTDNLGHTPLHVAAIGNNVPAIRALLTLGAKVSCRNAEGRTALNWACIEGNLEAVKLLVEMGQGKISEQSDNGSHPLYLAAQKGHEDLMHYLLLKAAPVNLPDAKGVSPLMAAVLYNRAGCVRMLLRAGADVSAARSDGRTVLVMAVIMGDLEVLQMLLERGADVNKEGADQFTPLYAACHNKHENQKAIVGMLLKYPVDVNCICVEGNTPLTASIRHNDVELVSLLLNAGALPGGVFHQHATVQTPLHLAAALKLHDIVKLLLSRGANVNEVEKNGITPLFVAVEAEDLELVRIFIEAGADLDAVSNKGRTAIAHAVGNGVFEIAKALVEAGANVDIPDPDGVTPLHSALQAGDASTPEVLIRHGANVNRKLKGSPPICLATSAGSSACVQLLLDVGANPDAVDGAGDTALYWAALQGMVETVKVLINAGANSNLKGKDGAGALHVAAMNGDAEIVQLLLDGGADPFLKTNGSRTALHIAVTMRHKEVVKLLGDSMKGNCQGSSVGSQTRPSSRVSSQGPSEKLSLGDESDCQLAALCCPITKVIMTDPVVAEDGHTYERAAITKWIQKRGTSPLTNQPLSIEALVPNLNIEGQIVLYRATYGL